MRARNEEYTGLLSDFTTYILANPHLESLEIADYIIGQEPPWLGNVAVSYYSDLRRAVAGHVRYVRRRYGPEGLV